MTQPLLRIAGFRQTADFLNRCMIIDREDNRPCFNNRPGEQQNSTLYQAPFSPAQAAAIMIGRIPAGQL